MADPGTSTVSGTYFIQGFDRNRGGNFVRHLGPMDGLGPGMYHTARNRSSEATKMNGVHDMGGMHGFGPIPREENEAVFHASWEGRMFGMLLNLGRHGGRHDLHAARHPAREGTDGPRAAADRDRAGREADRRSRVVVCQSRLR